MPAQQGHRAVLLCLREPLVSTHKRWGLKLAEGSVVLGYSAGIFELSTRLRRVHQKTRRTLLPLCTPSL